MTSVLKFASVQRNVLCKRILLARHFSISLTSWARDSSKAKKGDTKEDGSKFLKYEQKYAETVYSTKAHRKKKRDAYQNWKDSRNNEINDEVDVKKPLSTLENALKFFQSPNIPNPSFPPGEEENDDRILAFADLEDKKESERTLAFGDLKVKNETHQTLAFADLDSNRKENYTEETKKNDSQQSLAFVDFERDNQKNQAFSEFADVDDKNEFYRNSASADLEENCDSTSIFENFERENDYTIEQISQVHGKNDKRSQKVEEVQVPSSSSIGLVTKEKIVEKQTEEHKFENLPLHRELVKRLHDLEFPFPTAVQFESLKETLKNKSVVVQAETGSGKTLAYLLPIVQSFLKRTKSKKFKTERSSPRAVILLPSRDLVRQVQSELTQLAPNLTIISLIGGVNIKQQRTQLINGADVIIGTIGRIEELYAAADFGLKNVKHFVIDEADMMIDSSNRAFIQTMILKCHQHKQLMFFSATITDAVKLVANEYMVNGKFINLKGVTGTVVPKQILHKTIPTTERNLHPVILDILLMLRPNRCMIFVKDKSDAYKTANTLWKHGINSLYLNSDMLLLERERTLFSFREGLNQVLVVTDIAARGVDIPACDVVIQTPDCISSIENYIHRAGRSGRAGRKGTNYQLTYDNDAKHQRFLKSLGFVVDLAIEARPSLEEVSNGAIDHAIEALSDIPMENVELANEQASKLLESSKTGGRDEIAKLLASLCRFQALS